MKIKLVRDELYPFFYEGVGSFMPGVEVEVDEKEHKKYLKSLNHVENYQDKLGRLYQNAR